MIRQIALVFLGLIVAFPAWATNYTVTFCGKYAVDYDDASTSVGDDYFTSNADKVARGAYIRVRRDSDSHDMYANFTPDDGGSGVTGCTSALVLSSTSTYTVTLYSTAYVNGNYIRVMNNPDDVTLYAYTAYSSWSPSSTTTLTFTTTSIDVGPWNLAAAAGYAIFEHNGLVTGETYQLFRSGCNPVTHLSSCTKGSDMYYDPTTGGDNDKYIIVHELGHGIGAKKHGSGPDHDYDALLQNCYTSTSNNDGQHEMNSKEYQSSAASEGWAHYYAAITFNDDTDSSTCKFKYYKSVDWDLDHDGGVSAPVVNCQGAPVTGIADTGGDYLGNMCYGTLSDRGTEYDWLRFWWDLHTVEGVSFAKTLCIVDDADWDTWNASGDGSGGAYPSNRLRNGANTEGVLTEWDNQDHANGVDR